MLVRELIENFQRLFAVFRANLRAMERYTVQPYEGHLLLFRAAEGAVADGDLGWGERAARGVELQLLPGNHFSLLREPQVRRIAAELGRRLASET